MRHILEVIQAYCLEERLLPLTVLTVNAHSGMPGAGAIAADRRHADAAMRDTVAYPLVGASEPLRICHSRRWAQWGR